MSKKKSFLVSLLLSAGVVFSAYSQPSRVELAPDPGIPIAVVFWYGQSNAAGNGQISTLPSYLQVQPSILYSYLNNNEPGAWGPLRGKPNPNGTIHFFGGEITMGHGIRTNSDAQFAIIKICWNGTGLAPHPDPLKTWSPTVPDSLYYQSRDYADAMIQQLRDQGYAPTVVGAAWTQGEADSRVLSKAVLYGTNLIQLLNSWRTDYSNPDMCLYVGMVSPESPDYPYVAEKQASILAAAGIDPLIYPVVMEDLPLRDDMIHLTPESHVIYGYRISEKVLESGVLDPY